MKKETILVVDDAPDTLELVRRNLEMEGWQCYTAPGVEEAVTVLGKISIDLVITDMKMPRAGGMDMIAHIKANYKNTAIMVITGYATIEGAVQAVRHGAEDYLAKPFTDDELFAAVNRVLEQRRHRLEMAGKTNAMPVLQHGIIGESAAMLKVYELIAKASMTSATTLINGASGTGKELVARAIHYGSDRAGAPFVPVNCAAIPEDLLGSELFGYVKGAFTGAASTRPGFFQTADGGSIFLDEIGEMSLSMQAKILRVLQDKEVTMVGARKGQKVDLRIIAATNKNLSSLVEKGLFREDLFWRLNVIYINLPPLVDRDDDIFILVRQFAHKYSRELGRPVMSFTDNALDVMRRYRWPGNVRELENLIQSLCVMVEAPKADVPDLPPYMRYSAVKGQGLNRTLEAVEEEHIRNVLALTKGNKSKAADILGIDRKTLKQKLDKMGQNTPGE